ncbi:hypothetical protein H2200_007568 [Cladophialophora chaetospira]|uniref:Formamidopyrimidine-DNA glycosylase catalytic domain-containing protein n=1 Tax=Cladophialophora chaetospira TaxID=386627 RepID=A0AA38X604_9EURO|nr:hypothetical protein H2200_007568 [Cladophialophora chaetospira]
MPEIAEVARTVHFIRKLLVGKTLAKVTASEDAIVYGKVGTSAAEFEKHMSGKTVVDAGQQGKYFWMIMSSPPHPVMHFGMSGWLKFKSEHTYYYQPKKGEKQEEWPPRFLKFMLETKAENGEDAVEAAFVDMRRLARIRLVDCPGEEIRKNSPLKENGPDPVIDKDTFTVDWLKKKCNSKKVPIKAMLLDQANISGIGNWVGDEVLYNAKIHPEQYANTLQDEQIEQLHKSIHYVCTTSVELLADSDKFPADWLFKHRWQKGKKNASGALPNGQKIAFLTVGGRTSAVVPSVQKKTGPVAKDMDEAEFVDGADEAPKKAKKANGTKRKAVKEEDGEDDEQPKKKMPSRSKKAAQQENEDTEEEVMPKKTTPRGRKTQVKEAQEDTEEEVMPKKTTARGRKAQVKEEQEDKAEPMAKGHAKSPKRTKAPLKVEEEAEEEEEEKKPATPAKKATGRGKATKSAAPETAANVGRRRSGRRG